MNIDKIFKYGSLVYLTDGKGWRSENFKAFVEPLRYKNKIYLEGSHTEIGVNENDVYVYIGPKNHDITLEGKGFVVNDFHGRTFSIDKAEKILVNDTCIYIWAIIRKKGG